MNELINLIKEYPKVGIAIISIISGTLGWFFRNVFQLIIDNIKYKKEIKTFFWKEKINASKKASEFYLEHLNFISLLREQYSIYETGKIEHKDIVDVIENEVKAYAEKLKNFPHFEHHHINLFYEFIGDNRVENINKESINSQKRITELKILDTDNQVVVENKIKKIQIEMKKLKKNYDDLFKIYKKYIEFVRKDLKEYV